MTCFLFMLLQNRIECFVETLDKTKETETKTWISNSNLRMPCKPQSQEKIKKYFLFCDSLNSQSFLYCLCSIYKSTKFDNNKFYLKNKG